MTNHSPLSLSMYMCQCSADGDLSYKVNCIDLDVQRLQGGTGKIPSNQYVVGPHLPTDKSSFWNPWSSRDTHFFTGPPISTPFDAWPTVSPTSSRPPPVDTTSGSAGDGDGEKDDGDGDNDEVITTAEDNVDNVVDSDESGDGSDGDNDGSATVSRILVSVVVVSSVMVMVLWIRGVRRHRKHRHDMAKLRFFGDDMGFV